MKNGDVQYIIKLQMVIFYVLPIKNGDVTELFQIISGISPKKEKRHGELPLLCRGCQAFRR